MTDRGIPEYGNTLDTAPDALIGQRVGNFTVRRLLGAGAMGSVYLGTHDTLDRYVAIKVLLPQLATSEILINRFRDEAIAASRLGHPGLIQVFDFGTLPDGRRYSVMEFLDGRDLETALSQDGPQPASRVAAIGAQVASGLEAAHRKGIVHRDLKPANIFLVRDENGAERVKVLDFGIAKLLAGQQGKHTADGHIVGTPEYMAPEQASATVEIDRRADIYSLGCVLYELLTGTPPHTALSIPAILVAQLQAHPVPPTQLRSGIPPAMEAIVLRCLEKRREDRFQSMEELRAALEPLAEGTVPRPSREVALPPPTQPSFPVARPASRYIVLITFALALAAGAAFLIVSKSQPKRAAMVADADGAGVVAIVEADAAEIPWTPEPALSTVGSPYRVDDKGAIAAGAVIWSAKCARCHGDRGQGGGAELEPGTVARSFAETSGDSELTDLYRYEVVRRGAAENGMPAFADELSDDDIWRVVTFVRTLTAKTSAGELDLDAPQPKTSSALVRRGKELYRAKCRSCHGGSGRGNGRAAKFLGRLPTDLTWGIYKLRSTPKDVLPTDWDIFRTLTVGVGTGIMPGFPKLPPDDRWALVAYVKTLSSKFKKGKPTDVLVVPDRRAPSDESVARGKAVFQMSGCPKCHGREGLGDGPKADENKDARGNRVEPPDFTDPYDLLSGSRPEDIFRTLWNGLSGVPMPMGQTLLTEEDAWDVVNWILSVQRK